METPQENEGRRRLGAKRRVLVIDDNVDAARMLAVMLSAIGHEVEYAINGNAGLALAEEFKPEVVFVDLNLPDISGWAVTRALRRRAGLERTRVYAITGQYGPEARERSLSAGCDDHLVKPVHPDVLERLVAGEDVRR